MNTRGIHFFPDLKGKREEGIFKYFIQHTNSLPYSNIAFATNEQERKRFPSTYRQLS